MSGSHTTHYEGDAGRNYHYSKRAIPEEAYDWVSRARAEKIQPQVKPGDVVYELGVGAGWNLAELRCAKKLGLDVAQFLEEGLTSRGIEFISDYKKVPLATVNVVICHHVLEHLIDPAETLRELHAGLSIGAKLLIFVPFETGARFRRFDPNEPNHHLFSWNVQSMGNLVKECGFTIENAKVGPFGYDRFAAAWAVRTRMGEKGFRVVRKMLQIILPMKEVRLIARR